MKTVQQQMEEIVAGFEAIEEQVELYFQTGRAYKASCETVKLLEAMEPVDAEDESLLLSMALDLRDELWERREEIKVRGTREFGVQEFCEALIAEQNKPTII